MRSAPKTKPDLEKLKASKAEFAKSDTLSLDVELITPLFGGGVETKKVDEVCWLRGSEVKASLRFWWRALYGHHYPTSKDLHIAESKCFGSAKGNEGVASPVAVGVVELSRPKAVDAASIQDVRKGAYYPNEGEVIPAGATAKLTLRFPSKEWEFKEEVIRALVYWMLFGGVGARSRRGAGAIAPKTHKDADVINYPSHVKKLDKCRSEFPQPKALKQYFSLTNGAEVLVQKSGKNNAEAVHRELMDHWRAFRQCRVHPPNWMGAEGWGLSTWPEPDHVRFRRVNQGRIPRHRAQMVDANRGKAPRVLLGAPIVLHWMQGRKAEGIQDAEFGLSFPTPGNTRERRFVDRYASPVLLSVARFWEDGNPEYRGLVLVTEATFQLAGGAPCLKESPNETLAVNGFTPVPNRGNGYAVRDASSMVDQIVRAFSQPLDDTVTATHFEQIKNA